MLPKYPGGHAAYQKFVVEQLHNYYDDPADLPGHLLDIAERLWEKDLTEVDTLMQDCYSRFGPTPRPSSCMLRSALLSIAVGISSYSKWVEQMRIVPAYAILSGFQFGNSPGVGTFADFFSRLWQLPSSNILPKEQPPKRKVKKPEEKGAKAAPTEKTTVDALLRQLEKNAPSEKQPFSLLFGLFKELFLDESVDRGLIDPSALSLSGDGTPVVTSAQQRKKRLCTCKETGITDCSCNRHFSQPDCDIGWDSHRGRFFNGYDLYILTAADSESDLPIFPMLHPASRHDSFCFAYTFFTMRTFLPEYRISKLLLDSAHDAMPIYDYCRRNRIAPFIDLNSKRGRPTPYKDDFRLAPDGVPLCMAGLKMRHDGVEASKHRSKFRCPLMNRSTGICSCETPCSHSKFGRTVHLAMKDNPRLINIPPRDSEAWKTEYAARTSSERCNKRLKNDFHLEAGQHRCTKMWYGRLYLTMMLQHLTAWPLPQDSAFRMALKSAA